VVNFYLEEDCARDIRILKKKFTHELGIKKIMCAMEMNFSHLAKVNVSEIN